MNEGLWCSVPLHHFNESHLSAQLVNELACRSDAPPLGLQHRVPEPVLSLEAHHPQVKDRSNECRYVGRKEETRMKCNGRGKMNGKTPRYERRRGKAMDSLGLKHGR